MQPTACLHVHVTFSGEPSDRVKYEIRRVDLVLWHAGVVFCVLFIFIDFFLQENIEITIK